MSAQQMTKTLSHVQRRLRLLERMVGLRHAASQQAIQQKSLERIYGLKKDKPISPGDLEKLRKQLWG